MESSFFFFVRLMPAFCFLSRDSWHWIPIQDLWTSGNADSVIPAAYDKVGSLLWQSLSATHTDPGSDNNFYRQYNEKIRYITATTVYQFTSVDWFYGIIAVFFFLSLSISIHLLGEKKNNLKKNDSNIFLCLFNILYKDKEVNNKIDREKRPEIIDWLKEIYIYIKHQLTEQHWARWEKDIYP